MHRFKTFGVVAASLFATLLFAAPASAGFHSKLNVGMSVIHTGTADLGTPTFNLNQSLPYDFPFGTSTGQAQQEFTDTRALSGSANENLDLSGSSLKDGLNNNLAFTKVMFFAVHAAATNGGNIVVSPGASNGFAGPFGGTSPTVSIPADGMALFVAPVAGWTVTNSTGDLLNIANSDSASASYDIYIVGH